MPDQKRVAPSVRSVRVARSVPGSENRCHQACRGLAVRMRFDYNRERAHNTAVIFASLRPLRLLSVGARCVGQGSKLPRSASKAVSDRRRSSVRSDDNAWNLGNQSMIMPLAPKLLGAAKRNVTLSGWFHWPPGRLWLPLALCQNLSEIGIETDPSRTGTPWRVSVQQLGHQSSGSTWRALRWPTAGRKTKGSRPAAEIFNLSAAMTKGGSCQIHGYYLQNRIIKSENCVFLWFRKGYLSFNRKKRKDQHMKSHRLQPTAANADTPRKLLETGPARVGPPRSFGRVRGDQRSIGGRQTAARRRA